MDAIEAMEINAMITLNIDEIQHNLSEFIKLIQEGNSLIITQADKPIAEIKPIPTKPPQKERRPIGLCEGEFVVPDNFNDPLPEEILFNGKVFLNLTIFSLNYRFFLLC
jgi:antitoxin (DNA-binding transcriptional repressor) of toxin-antitoxin stability system